MVKALKPEGFEGSPNTTTSLKEFNHWFKTFEYFIEGLNKLKVLTNFVAPSVYDYFSKCTTYDDAIETTKQLYVKPTNKVFARHLLPTRKHHSGETLDEFLQVLKTLGKDCDLKDVNVKQYKQEAVRDAFITGIQSNHIRQHLLENKTLKLQDMFDS